jgi:hypothetical protein
MQRGRFPYDNHTVRLLDAPGGPPPPVHPRTLTNGIVNQFLRFPETSNDDLITRDRVRTFHAPYAILPGISKVSYTDAGPIPTTLRQMNFSLVRGQGTSNSRAYDPEHTGKGLHTNPAKGKAAMNARYQATQQMRPVRQYRLNPSRRSGQTFSETTRVQGG